jgi:hypothetical protein
MRIVYCALKRLQVGADVREAGDLVPEAASWTFLQSYVREGKLMPVLVATLPEEQQVMLLEWEAEQNGVADTGTEPVDVKTETKTPDKGEKGKVA